MSNPPAPRPVDPSPNPGRRAFLARAGIPGEDRKKDSYIVAVKIVDEFFEGQQTAGQVAQKVELIAIVHANVGINVPEQDSVDRAEAGFRLGKEFFGCVLARFRIIDGTVPHEKLDLRKRALRPSEIGIGVVGEIHFELRAALGAPGLHAGKPSGVGRIGGAGEEYLCWSGWNRESHGAVGGDQGVAGFPLVGVQSGRAEKHESSQQRNKPETGTAQGQAHRQENISEAQKTWKRTNPGQ